MEQEETERTEDMEFVWVVESSAGGTAWVSLGLQSQVPMGPRELMSRGATQLGRWEVGWTGRRMEQEGTERTEDMEFVWVVESSAGGTA